MPGQFLRGIAIAPVVLMAALSFPDAAPAHTLEPVVEQNVSKITEHSARGGATSVPGVSCGDTCQELFLSEHETAQDVADAQEIHRELRTLRSSTGLSPGLRALGTIGLAANVFELGWKIGQGIDAKLLRVQVPPRETLSQQQRLRFAAQGEAMNDYWSSESAKARMPSMGGF